MSIMQNTFREISALLTISLVLLGGCEFFSPNLPSVQELIENESRIVNDKNVVVLVRSEDDASRLIVNAARRDYQLVTKIELDGLGLVLLDFNRPPGVNGDVAIQDMESASPGATAGLEHLYTLQSDLDVVERKPRLYAGDMVAWPENGCRAHTAIGMIDGYVNPAALPLPGVNLVTRNFSRGEPKAEEHAAAIADLLVGGGRLKNAQLYSASVVSDITQAQSGAGVVALIEALNWMQMSGVSLVNVSLAGPYNKLLDRAIQRAAAKGMRIIAAAGNDGPKAQPRYPAAFSSVIAVTAIDSDKEVYPNAVRGEHVDFSAPGVDVFVENGRGGKYLSGTSVAAPFVTALIASDKNFASLSEIGSIRSGISKNAVDLGDTGRDPVYGMGLIKSRFCDREINTAR